MKKKEYCNEEAVSPVIGVMLMIVVTVILAAAVSGYAGGLTGNMKKAPQLAMDVSIKNTGYAGSSYIAFDVIGVSEPIPTKDLKIITNWNANGATGGNTVTAWNGTINNQNAFNTVVGTSSTFWYQSPLGFGKGVTVQDQGRQKTSTKYDYGQYFGEYTLVSGTSMKNSPWYSGTNGYGMTTPYVYTGLTSGYKDGMQAILGDNWNELRSGDIVDIMIVHIPSNKVIFEKNVGVE